MSPSRRLLAVPLLALGLAALLEGAAALAYRLTRTEQEREGVELLLGLRGSEANSALRYAAHPYFDFISNPEFRLRNGTRPHNALGLRGPLPAPKAAGTLRIVAVGGSTTYGMNFSFERNAWPALLQELLRRAYGPAIEVINAGTPYYTTAELIGLTAMRVPELAPDVVLLHAGLTDAFTCGYPDEGGPDGTAFRHAYESGDPLPGWSKPWMRRSYLARLAGMRLALAGGYTPGDMAASIQYPPPPEAEIARNAAAYTGRYFRRNLRTLVALCRNAGATPVLLAEPMNPAREGARDVYHAAVVAAVRTNNRIMREVAAETGVPFVDLYGAMRDPGAFTDIAHENQAGMAQKAAAVASGIGPLVAGLLHRP
jgi:lysophospholipase L1-like esterase